MPALITIITATEELSRAIDRNLMTLLAEHVDVCYMTYEESRLSPRLIEQTDLFLLELLRKDALGYRAEGLFLAQRFTIMKKKSFCFQGNKERRI